MQVNINDISDSTDSAGNPVHAITFTLLSGKKYMTFGQAAAGEFTMFLLPVLHVGQGCMGSKPVFTLPRLPDNILSLDPMKP